MRRRPDHFLPSDTFVPWRRHLAVIGLSAVALGALLGIGRSPDAVETLFVEGFGTDASRLLSWMTSHVPFSVAELVQAGLILWLVLAPLSALRAVYRGHRRLMNAVFSGLMQVASVASVAIVLFYGVWGLNYARAPAVQRLGWEPVRLHDPGALDELAALAEELVDITNAHYLAIHGVPDAGEPTAREADLDALFDASFERITRELDLHPSFALPRGPAKPFLASPIVSWLGISGFYFPFTGEAGYNTMPPAWQQPHTIAHEKAHQRGIASEDEANFFGFLACIHSDDPYVAYSGWLFAQRRLLSTLLKSDRARGRALLERRLPGVQRDIDVANAFWTEWDGYGHLLGQTVNNAYLKTHRVEGGIRSYSLSARLIVAYARQRGGTFDRLGTTAAIR